MFDGLRNDASNSSEFDKPVEFFPEDKPATPRAARRKSPGRWLGLTAPQRFILALMLMLATCVMGMMCLLVFGKFVIPF